MKVWNYFRMSLNIYQAIASSPTGHIHLLCMRYNVLNQ